MTMQEEYDRHFHPEEHVGEAKGAEHDAAETSRGPLPGSELEKSQGGGGEKRNDPALSHTRQRMLIGASVALFLAVAGFIGYGVYQRGQRNQAAKQELDNRKNRIPELRTEKVKAVDTPREIHLPATPQAFDAATIYARQSGYISKRLVDIGSRVKNGDLLAVISAPEVDDQLTQARAQLQQMQATLEQTEATPGSPTSRTTASSRSSNKAGRRSRPATRTAIILPRKMPPWMSEIQYPGAEGTNREAGEASVLRARRGPVRWGYNGTEYRYRQPGRR